MPRERAAPGSGIPRPRPRRWTIGAGASTASSRTPAARRCGGRRTPLPASAGAWTATTTTPSTATPCSASTCGPIPAGASCRVASRRPVCSTGWVRGSSRRRAGRPAHLPGGRDRRLPEPVHAVRSGQTLGALPPGWPRSSSLWAGWRTGWVRCSGRASAPWRHASGPRTRGGSGSTRWPPRRGIPAARRSPATASAACRCGRPKVPGPQRGESHSQALVAAITIGSGRLLAAPH